MTSKTHLSNPKILILGKGYIGTHLYFYFFDWKPILASSSHVNYHDRNELREYLLKNEIDVVINASGFTGRPNVDEAELKKSLCWKLNVSSPLNVNRLCNELGIKYLHISSGCIYDGYDKVYDETDPPNFGLFDYSSFYSKTKHAFELMSQSEGLSLKILRVRMPLMDDSSARNYLIKIKKYDNLIDYRNSKTFLPSLFDFIMRLLQIETPDFWEGPDIYNVVNPEPLTTREITQLMTHKGHGNPNWKFVDMKSLDITAPRSNCILDHRKVNLICPLKPEKEIIEEILNVWTDDQWWKTKLDSTRPS